MEGALLLRPDTDILPAHAPYTNMATLANRGKRAGSVSAGGSAGAYGDTRVIQDQAALVVDQRAGEAEGGSGVAVALVPGLVGQPRVALLQSLGAQAERADVRGWH